MNKETIDRIRKFSEDRDWDQFHGPANLAKSIVIEAAELLECFQWCDDNFNLQHVKEELADVLALIRPNKKHLIDKYVKNKQSVRKELYKKVDASDLRKSHAIPYALLIVLQLHLIKANII